MVLEKKRRLPLVDRLPEHVHYQDTGCTVAPSCLHCPLERCIYDEPLGDPGAHQETRDAEIFRRYQETAAGSGRRLPDIRSLAAHFGVSRRTIHRVVQRMRRRQQSR
ncbi:MAG: GntR family transcriptional regulator [Chloroflexi bacterium]|nr:GntR family transcriptional regulator [Chloroflexota bacterium]